MTLTLISKICIFAYVTEKLKYQAKINLSIFFVSKVLERQSDMTIDTSNKYMNRK